MSVGGVLITLSKAASPQVEIFHLPFAQSVTHD